MAFFKGFNFVRALTLLSLIGACVLGYLSWDMNKIVGDLEQAMAPGGEVENFVRTTQANGITYTKLDKDRDSDKLIGQNDPEEYIRKVAGKDRVDLGQVNVRVGTASSRGKKDVIDHTYRIELQNKDQALYRSKIGNFLYSLEMDSPRVRVTDLRIDPAEKRIDPHEYPQDRWTFECTITSREKVKE